MTRLSIARAAGVALVLAAAALVADPQGEAGATSPAWLTRLNAVRTDAGLHQVTESTSVVAAMRRHVAYLLHTPASQRTGKYASVHTENPKSKYYSASGAQAAAHSDISSGSAADVDVVDGFLAAPFHALTLLDPRATWAALYRDAGSGEAMLEVAANFNTQLPATPVRIPTSRTTQTRASSEHPDPTESCRHDTGASYASAALPIIVLLPDPPVNPTATLTAPNGSTVSSSGADLCLIYEGHFYTTDPVYGPSGEAGLEALHAVFIIARHPLVKGNYTVSLDYGAGSPLTWTFASLPAVQYPHLEQIGGQCSFTHGASGGVAFGLYDTLDGTPTATYHVTLGRTSHAASLREGGAKKIVFTGLSVGTHTAHVSGPVSFSQPVYVPGCPAWVAARVRLRSLDPAHERVSITLDNRHNAHAVHFTVHDTKQKHATYRIRGASERTVHAVAFKYRTTTISVSIGSHTIYRAKIG